LIPGPRQAALLRCQNILPLAVLLAASFTGTANAAEGSEAEPSAGALIVELTGMKSDKGQLVYAMWSGSEGWLKTNTVHEGSVPIVDGVSEIRFEDLPYGEYAISVYQDKNDNGKLDTGLFGIPKEAFGFSNDPTISFGPPKYKGAAFMLEEPELTVRISVKKLF
jgi:uncharacterized protein (DUF2141 family)